MGAASLGVAEALAGATICGGGPRWGCCASSQGSSATVRARDAASRTAFIEPDVADYIIDVHAAVHESRGVRTRAGPEPFVQMQGLFRHVPGTLRVQVHVQVYDIAA